MREITYVKAFTESLMQLMAEDEDVVVIGEDVAHYGGVFHAFDGLWKTYGERRVIDTPISEMGFIGMGVGAAAHLLAQLAIAEGQSVYAFTRQGDAAAQDLISGRKSPADAASFLDAAWDKASA